MSGSRFPAPNPVGERGEVVLDEGDVIEQARSCLAACRAAETAAHAKTLQAEGALDALIEDRVKRASLSRLMTTREVAEHLRTTADTVRALKQRGKLRCVQVGDASPRFREEDLAAFVQRQLVPVRK